MRTIYHLPKIPLCFVNVSNDELEQTLTFLLSEGLQNVHGACVNKLREYDTNITWEKVTEEPELEGSQ